MKNTSIIIRLYFECWIKFSQVLRTYSKNNLRWIYDMGSLYLATSLILNNIQKEIKSWIIMEYMYIEKLNL